MGFARSVDATGQVERFMSEVRPQLSELQTITPEISRGFVVIIVLVHLVASGLLQHFIG
jgi:hypothetical protein